MLHVMSKVLNEVNSSDPTLGEDLSAFERSLQDSQESKKCAISGLQEDMKAYTDAVMAGTSAYLRLIARDERSSSYLEMRERPDFYRLRYDAYQRRAAAASAG